MSSFINFEHRTLQFPALLFCLSNELQGIEPGSTAELPSTLNNKPNTWKNGIFTCIWKLIMKPFWSRDLQSGELSFPNGWKFCLGNWKLELHFQIFLLPKPKVCFSILMFIVHLCAKFADSSLLALESNSKANNWWTATSINSGKENCDFLSTKCLINVDWSLQSTDCAVENLKPQVMLLDWRGD